MSGIVNYIIDFRARVTMVLLLALFPGSFIVTFLFCITPFFWPLVIAYAIYIYFDSTPDGGGCGVPWIRNLPVWEWFCEYFPASVIKEVELDPKRNYVFGYHPHGPSALGAFINFGTNCNRVDQLFEGLNIRPLTLKDILSIPFLRELLLALGLRCVTKTSIKNILSKGPGHSCLIVPGGIEEALIARSGNLKLVLLHRVGFIKQAIENGADLVPVFGFGENQIFEQIDNQEGTLANKIQTLQRKFTRLTLPFFIGRGFFLKVGIFPFRVPLVAVVGKPIKVVQNPQPSKELIAQYQQQYLDSLTELYNRNKDKYWPGGNAPDIELV